MPETMSQIPEEEMMSIPKGEIIEDIDDSTDSESVENKTKPPEQIIEPHVKELAEFMGQIGTPGGPKAVEDYLQHFEAAKLFKENLSSTDNEFTTEEMKSLAETILNQGREAVEHIQEAFQLNNGEAGLIDENEIQGYKPYAEFIKKQGPKGLEIIKIGEQTANTLIKFADKILKRIKGIEAAGAQEEELAA